MTEGTFVAHGTGRKCLNELLVPILGTIDSFYWLCLEYRLQELGMMKIVLFDICIGLTLENTICSYGVLHVCHSQRSLAHAEPFDVMYAVPTAGRFGSSNLGCVDALSLSGALLVSRGLCGASNCVEDADLE
jgi:hypothetical protein